ncbi:helix-turn-helix transcriptional regulator [Candidatus Glomeribacter gigasporarum]|uniref:helix-turn-helix transcriptional regulator n=1 Tax=Candidatus Glomeribacter gigasporarum TaxID=132144 RepID=UPI0003043E5B|nr:helix-turn-helix transcriptional regulator [Candidatus Glomeribacter gigasporarum]
MESPQFSDEEKEQFIDKLLFSYLMPVELILSPELTQREQECFRLAELNLNSAEIGERLGIKKTTVISRLKAAKRKLGCHSLLEAICQAMKQRYLKGTIENPRYPPHG